MLKKILIVIAICFSLNPLLAQHRGVDSLNALDCFIEAERFKMIEDYQQAEQQYLKVLDIEPQYDPAMFELGRLYLEQHKIEEALHWTEQAYHIDPNNKWYAEYLGALYKMTGNLSKLIEIYEQVLKQEPQNTDYLEDIFQLYLHTGQKKKALAYLNKIEEIKGLDEDIAFIKRDLLLQEGKMKEAIALIEDLHQQAPQEPKYCNMIAEMYMKNNQPKKALYWYKQVMKLNDKDPYIHITLADYYKKVNQLDSAFYYLKKSCANPNLSLTTKVQALGSLIDNDSQFADENSNRSSTELAKILTETHPDEGMAHAIYGSMLMHDSLYAQAQPELALAIAADSTNYRLWDQMLLTLGNLEAYDELVSYSHRAIRFFPNMVFPYYMNALANFLTGNMRAAITISQLGVKISPTEELSEQFFMISGDAYHSLNNNDSAFIAYDKALSINPNNAVVLNNYAYYLSLENKDLIKAEQMSAKAIAADPNPNNLDTYAWVLFCLKDYAKAESYITKVLKQDKSPSSEVYSHAGDIFFHNGHGKKAVKYWRKALQLSPEDTLLQQKVMDETYYEALPSSH